MPVTRPRSCDTCSQPYWRRNLVELWTVRNEGHRTGWTKVKVKQCMQCQGTRQSVAILNAAHVAVGARGAIRLVR